MYIDRLGRVETQAEADSRAYYEKNKDNLDMQVESYRKAAKKEEIKKR